LDWGRIAGESFNERAHPSPVARHSQPTPSWSKIARYEQESFPIQCAATVLLILDRRYYAAFLGCGEA
jgi:hypothetical protein